MKYHPIFDKYLKCKDSPQVFRFLQESLTNSITMWDYFVNWGKVIGNVKDFEIDLNTLNYLVGKPDTKAELAALLAKDPHLVRTLPILLATRAKSIDILVDARSGQLQYKHFVFEPKADLSPGEIADICEFAEKTGLLNLFRNKDIRSVPDYVLGVEVGLDSNGRKNRGGTTMEGLVGDFIDGFCERNQLPHATQATAGTIWQQCGIRVQADKASRRFDYAIRKGKTLYLVETNFYGAGGSKLKATAGEYQTLFDLLSQQGIHFIWVTDGLGWRTTLRPLEEAFNHIDYTLNLKMMMTGLFAEIIQNEL